MKKDKIIKWVGVIIYFLFFPVFWAVKRITKSIFNHRRNKAIKEANERHIVENRKIFVVQIEKHFIAGTREELRRYDKVGCKAVKKLGNSHLLDFDYRKAIIYMTK